MRRAHAAVGALVHLDQAIEHRVAGQAAPLHVFHVGKPFAVGFTPVQLELRVVQRAALQAMELVAGLVQALVNGFELALHQRLHHVDAQLGDVAWRAAGQGALRHGIAQMAQMAQERGKRGVGKRGPGWGKG